MNHVITAILALTLIASARPALAQEPEPKPSDVLKLEHTIRPPVLEGAGNAALEYYKIWDSLSRADRNSLGEAAGDLKEGPGTKLTPAQRKLILAHQGYVDDLIRASTMECDWGPQLQDGYDFLLPHLGMLRGSCRVLRMDAFRCMDDGNPAAAAARIAAIYRLAGQVRGDKVLISSLVGEAIAAVGAATTTEMIKDKTLTPAAARLILAAIQSYPKNDPFGLVAALEMERAEAQLVGNKFRGEHAGADFLLKMYTGYMSTPNFFHHFLTRMNEQQYAADLARLDKFYEKAITLWKQPDSYPKLQELAIEVDELQYGITATVLATSLDRLKRGHDRAIRQLEHVRGELTEHLKQQENATP